MLVSGGRILRKYEVIFIIRPDSSEETVAAVTEKAQEQVTRNGGIILGLENLGSKKLAYEIQRFTEGIYVKMDIEASGEVLDALSRHFAMSEDVIRHQSIRPPKNKKAAR